MKNHLKIDESKKIVTVFSIASFLNDMGSDMIYPIWPLFVTSFLKADMAILGLIDGLGNAIVSISQAMSGYLSDKLRKRKIFVWSGYLFGSLSRIGYGLSTVWQHLIPFRILDRAGKMRGAPRDAIIADVSTKKTRAKNFGMLRTFDHLGAVTGIVICILLFERLKYRNLLFLSAIPSLIGAILIFLFIKERKIEKIYRGFPLKYLSKNFRLFLLLSVIFSLGYFSYSFLLVYATEFGLETTIIPVLYLIFTVVASLTSFQFGKLADKLGRKPILTLSYALFGLMCLGFTLVKSSIGLIILFVIYGLHMGAMEPVQKTFVSELSPKNYRASSLGTYQMIIGLCAFPASFIAGLLWVNFGMNAPFYFSLCLTAVTITLMMFVKENV